MLATPISHLLIDPNSMSTFCFAPLSKKKPKIAKIQNATQLEEQNMRNLFCPFLDPVKKWEIF